MSAFEIVGSITGLLALFGVVSVALDLAGDK